MFALDEKLMGNSDDKELLFIEVTYDSCVAIDN